MAASIVRPGVRIDRSNFLVIDELLMNLTKHFTDDGATERQAKAQAFSALKIEPAAFAAAEREYTRQRRAEARDMDKFNRRAAAVCAAFGMAA